MVDQQGAKRTAEFLTDMVTVIMMSPAGVALRSGKAEPNQTAVEETREDLNALAEAMKVIALRCQPPL